MATKLKLQFGNSVIGTKTEMNLNAIIVHYVPIQYNFIAYAKDAWAIFKYRLQIFVYTISKRLIYLI